MNTNPIPWLRPIRRPRKGVLGTIPVPTDVMPISGPAAFQTGFLYTLVCWPIPSAGVPSITGGSMPGTNPALILKDLGFEITTMTSIRANPDGSVTVTAPYIGSGPGSTFTSSQADAADYIVFGRFTGFLAQPPVMSPTGIWEPTFKQGEVVQGLTSGIQALIVSEYDDQSSPGAGTLQLIATIGSVFTNGETLLGLTSRAQAVMTWQYTIVLVSPMGNGAIGVTSITKTVAPKPPLGKGGQPTGPNQTFLPPIPQVPIFVPPPPPPPPPHVPVPGPPPPPGPVKGTGPAPAAAASSSSTPLIVGAVVVASGLAYWAYSAYGGK